MQTRKEYLAGLNPPLAKIGKGRISAAGHAAIDEAVKNGMRFSDFNPGESVPVKSQESAKKNAPEEFFGATPDRLFDGGWFIRNTKGKKISVGGAEVCRNCKTSLDWHTCNMPVIPDIESGDMIPVLR